MRDAAWGAELKWLTQSYIGGIENNGNGSDTLYQI